MSRIIITLVIAFLATPAMADTVTAGTMTPFADDSGATESVKNECGFETRLPKYVQSYAKKAGVKVALTSDALDGVEGKVLYMTTTNIFAPGGGGYSGAKSATVEGKLMENGEVIGTFSDHRRALMGMMPGTCSMLKRVAKIIGKDIGEWLANPSMDAKLGDAH
ncbi:MAG: hypothetical protein OER91_07365 [Gammaproteobacteria bacterium]|nr:hypothetical protein [Gammaproteobacteria bacterium]